MQHSPIIPEFPYLTQVELSKNVLLFIESLEATINNQKNKGFYTLGEFDKNKR